MSAKSASTIPKIIKRDGPWCHYCGFEARGSPGSNTPEAPTRDHIFPRSLGGHGGFSNLRIAHRYCNSIRGIGEALSEKNESRHRVFVNKLMQRGFKHNPDWKGPANGPQPTVAKPVLTRNFYFSIGNVQIDIRMTRRGYWHLRLGNKTYALAEMGSEIK
jgi:hypothetical protein